MTSDDLELDQLMTAAFASVRPDAGLEDRLIAGFRAQTARRHLRMPHVPVHPMVRRAAVGVAAAILLGGIGLAVTHESRVNRYTTKQEAANTQLDLLVDGVVNHEGKKLVAPEQMVRQLREKLAQENTLDISDVTAQAGEKSELALRGPKVVREKPVERVVTAYNTVSELGDSSAPRSESHGIDATKTVDLGLVAGTLSTSSPVAAHNSTGSGGQRAAGKDLSDRFAKAPAARGTLQLGLEAGGGGARGGEAADAKKSAGWGFQPDHYNFEGTTGRTTAQPSDQNDSVMFSTDDFTGDTDADTLGRGLQGRRSFGTSAKGTDAPFGAPGISNGPALQPPAIQQQQQQGQSATEQNGKQVEQLRDLKQEMKQVPQQVQKIQQLAQAKPAEAQPDKAAQPPQPQTPQEANQSTRKIIRNGEMTFEVDGYDSAVLQITKIAAEEGGFVATTESEKLPNGKVKGSVVVRCPPERLDTLVLKLRGLGDLKNSRVSAQDITKQYTDLDAQLRAAKTMEERLLAIIKDGKGTVKELLEAEKQLGTWREKIERLEGEIRYYNNLVSLSTLTITLAERDVRAAGLLSESEQVNMGIEAADVEKARNEAIKAISDAKGRIVQSDLKKHDAGQFAAIIVADVAPDAAGGVTDRLKQLGRVARLEVQRRQATAEGTGAPIPGARVERKDTRLMLSIYNLADVKPRHTTSLTLAAEDVDKAYRAILEQIRSAGGRIVDSQLARPTPEQTTGTITFDAPTEAADVLLGALRSAGDVMRMDSSTTRDTIDVTDVKRGFTVQIQSLATVAPRESNNLTLAARDVPESFNKLRDAVQAAGGRILVSQLAEQNKNNVNGTLQFQVKRDNLAAIQSTLAEVGAVLARNVDRSSDTQNTVDSKVAFQVALVDERTVQPRESVSLQLAVDDVPSKHDKLLDALRDAGARVIESQINQQDPATTNATVTIDVRRETRPTIEKALADAGGVFGRAVSRPAEGQPALEDKLRYSITINDIDNLTPRETTTMGVETHDVTKAAGDIEATAVALGGRKVDSDWAQEQSGHTIARVVVDVPQSKSMDLIAKARDQGTVLTLQKQQTPNAPEGSFARARLVVTFATADSIVQRDQGLWASVRSGLATSVQWLLWSVTLIVIGLCLVLPWALIAWAGWRVVRRRRKGRLEVSAPAAPAT